MKQKGLLIAGFVLLGALAVAGWVRKPSAAVAHAGPALVPAQAVVPEEQAAAPAAPRSYAAPAVYRRPVRAQQVVRDREYVPARTAVKRQRPLSHSVAIVAGGAGAGAAIGALAGGGKGAAIGAISAGTAALIYDRITHQR